jgi:hypothetical protein
MNGQTPAFRPSEETSIWVEPCWDGWPYLGASSTSLDEDDASRPYLHWRLAIELLSIEADDVRRGTAIHKLWNAVDTRVRMLRRDYRLSDLKRTLGLPRKLETLRVLDYLGLARPLILEDLRRIRNSVEHADEGAPLYAACLRHIDSVWYFLRSTDSLAMRRTINLEWSNDLVPRADIRSSQFITFDFDSGAWVPQVRGRLPHEAIHHRPADGCIQVELDETPRAADEFSTYFRGRMSSGSPGIADVVAAYFAVDLPAHGFESRDAVRQG